MKKIRRINCIAGPCSGKSTTASHIFSEFKKRNFNIELVSEEVKEWTYIPRNPQHCDTHYIQSCQIQKEDIRLRAGVGLIVSDSPLILQYFYSYHHDVPLQSAILSAALEFESLYPSIHIFLNRKDKFYNKLGRYEDINEAKEIDKKIKQVMQWSNIKFVEFSCEEQDKIIEYLLEKIEE